jgi:hypothetical protein
LFDALGSAHPCVVLYGLGEFGDGSEPSSAVVAVAPVSVVIGVSEMQAAVTPSARIGPRRVASAAGRCT